MVFGYLSLLLRDEASKRGRNGFPDEEYSLEILSDEIKALAQSPTACEDWIEIKRHHQKLIDTLTGPLRKAIDAVQGVC